MVKENRLKESFREKEYLVEENEKLDLACHGSEKRQRLLDVKLGGVYTGESMVNLTCIDGTFNRLPKLPKAHCLFNFDSCFIQTKVSVEMASCRPKKLEPWIVRSQEKCSDVGADGIRSDLSNLTQISMNLKNSVLEI